MATRLLVGFAACLILVGCVGKNPVEPPASNQDLFDPHPLDGPPNPDLDFTISVDSSEFTVPATVAVTLHNASARSLMYWPQCTPAYEVWESDKWVLPWRVCYDYWPGMELAPGESRTVGVFEFAERGAFRVLLPVSDDAYGAQREYRSSWWIVR